MFGQLDDPTPPTPDAAGALAAAQEGRRRLRRRRRYGGALGAAIVVVMSVALVSELRDTDERVTADGAAAQQVTLTVRREQTEPIWTEGSTMVLRVSMGGEVIVEQELGMDHEAPVARIDLPAGTYRIDAAQRPCSANCQRPREPETHVCSEEITLEPPAVELVAVVSETGCTFRKGVGPSAEPEPGDPAVWFTDPASAPAADKSSFTAMVTRLGCAGGETGEVMRPGVVVDDADITITFTVEPGPLMATCPGNLAVPYEVHLGEAIGDRVLVDGRCAPGGAAAATRHCTDGGVRWTPPSADGASTRCSAIDGQPVAEVDDYRVVVLPAGFTASGEITRTTDEVGAADLGGTSTATQRFVDPSGRTIDVVSVGTDQPSEHVADAHQGVPADTVEVPRCMDTNAATELIQQTVTLSTSPDRTVAGAQEWEYGAFLVIGGPGVTADEVLSVVSGLRR